MRPRVRILAYHALRAPGQTELPLVWSAAHAVATETFRWQLNFMRAAGWKTLVPDEIDPAPICEGKKYAILTFDDGHQSDLIAASLMAEHGYRGIFYIPCAHIDREAFLKRSEIQWIAQQGCMIGSHGLTHAPLTRHSDTDLRDELLRSREILQDLVGRPVLDLAVPFGRYDRRVIAMARAAGYQRIMTSAIGVARVGESKVYPRLPVTARTSIDDFRRLLATGPIRVTCRRLVNALRRRLAPLRENHSIQTDPTS